MHISSAAIKRPLIAVCLVMLCGSTEAAEDCSVADVLANMNPLDAATADVAQRLGVLYAADDWWSKDPAAKELMEKVKAGGGRVWMIEGGHVDLSLSGLALRLPIYVDFVQERSP